METPLIPASRLPPRWLLVGVLVLSTALSFLDRQVLAALAPLLKQEFQLSNEGYGYVVSAFSLAYAVCAIPAGIAIDRIGLTRGITAVVALWSMAAMATGFTGGLAGLVACRAWLGAAEAGGIPATGKGFAQYLQPRERAVGTALNQVGITLGMVAAPLSAGWLAAAYGWRAAFVATGAAGFIWIPLWLLVVRRVPAPRDQDQDGPARLDARGPGRDWRLYALAAANILMMTVYSLWMNWTTVFLVSTHGLTQAQANQRLAWIPPLFASLGGLAGGWLSMWYATRGGSLYGARLKASAISALFLTSTAAVPLAPGAGLATALISLSFFMAVAMSANIYAMPLDLFGARRAAFAVSVLTASYGLMQAVVSPLFGRLIDQVGFGPVCGLTGLLPLAALGVLALVGRHSTTAPA
ncbi:MAG TPA: MFS transporter [Vicinamibacterales bacterium]|nr:MFS transporter [Vicinamibacterales bacterium]